MISKNKMSKLTFPQELRNIAQRVGRHEAGHYVVARTLGFRTGGLNIKFHDLNGGYTAGSDIILPTSITTIDEVTHYLRRRVKVLYAGVLAEAMENGEIDLEKALKYIREGGVADHLKVRELVNLIRSIEHGRTKTDLEAQSQLDALDAELWNAAADLVKVERNVIEDLGNRLASEVKFIGVLYEIQKSELEAFPALIERFGDG